MEANIWELVANFLLGWFIFKLGQWSIIWPIRSALRQGVDLNRLLKGEDAAVKIAVAEHQRMTIEKVQGQYYAYAEGTGDFLAQGRDFEEMFLTIKQRFPDSTWRIDRDVPGLTTEEVGHMTQTIFRVFGDSNEPKKD